MIAWTPPGSHMGLGTVLPLALCRAQFSRAIVHAQEFVEVPVDVVAAGPARPCRRGDGIKVYWPK